MSPDPCVTCIDRDDEDNYLLVACDGIYDFLPNQDIVDYVNERFPSEEHERDIVSNLIDLALYKVSLSVQLTMLSWKFTEPVFFERFLIEYKFEFSLTSK